MQQLSKEPRVYYVQDITILDIDPDQPPTFDDWNEADQFLLQQQQQESVSRWLVGMAASRLPKEDRHRNFESWCRRAKYDPGRVAVWRRMAELYDFRNEVQRFPELSHTHFEVMMGRVSKAKKAMPKDNGASYEEVMTDLQDANDNGESKKQMLARILEREGKSVPLSDLPLAIQGHLTLMTIDIGPNTGPALLRTCLVIIPKSESEGKQWTKDVDDRSLADEIVVASFARATTE